MRIERWYWLLVFGLVSLGIHAGLLLRSKSFALPPPPPKAEEIVVALEPLPEPVPVVKPEPKAKPEPKKTEPKPVPVAKHDSPLPNAPIRPKALVTKSPNVTDKPSLATKAPKVVPDDKRPTKPDVNPGGLERLRNEKPLASGLPSVPKTNDAPKLQIARNTVNPGGGGSPAPGPIPGGHGAQKGRKPRPKTFCITAVARAAKTCPMPRPGSAAAAATLSSP